MKQVFFAIILCAALLAAWSWTMHARYSPGRAPVVAKAPAMPSFRPLSPYPEVTEIPSPPPVPTVNDSLVCPDDMVKVDNFCIDIYEYPNIKGELPKNYVDWYQARQYCEAIGKRLCTEDEWIRACHSSGKPGVFQRFSYGDSYIMENCNVQNTRPVASGAFPRCRSFYGAYDMVGNVYEWVVPRSADKPIYTLGGAYGEGEGAMCYKAGAGYQPLYYQIHIGFRCCK
jgi:hypothetical protein